MNQKSDLSSKIPYFRIKLILVILKKSFSDFFKQQMRDDDKKKLMERMNSLETVTEDGPKTRRKGNLTSFCGLLRHQRDWFCDSDFYFHFLLSH